jgi:hypothetical protein
MTKLRTNERLIACALVVGLFLFVLLLLTENRSFPGAAYEGSRQTSPQSASSGAQDALEKRKAAAAYIGALDAKKGKTESIDTLRKSGLSDAEIKAYQAGNKP